MEAFPSTIICPPLNKAHIKALVTHFSAVGGVGVMQNYSDHFAFRLPSLNGILVQVVVYKMLMLQ